MSSVLRFLSHPKESITKSEGPGRSGWGWGWGGVLRLGQVLYPRAWFRITCTHNMLMCWKGNQIDFGLFSRGQFWLLKLWTTDTTFVLGYRYFSFLYSYSVQISPSTDRVVGDMRDVSAEILLQSFLQEALVSSSSTCRDAHSFMLSIQHFLCQPRCRPPSKVPRSMVLERLSWRVTCPNHASFRLLTVATRSFRGPIRKLQYSR